MNRTAQKIKRDVPHFKQNTKRGFTPGLLPVGLVTAGLHFNLNNVHVKRKFSHLAM
jgi:hypothetical protein